MLRGTQYGAFNARWLLPEEVAHTFVPLVSFSKLVREGHSVLMGPRGCGKTTLLKMLTRKALNTWFASGRDDKYPNKVNRPNYEAIYVPSDVRWLYELRDINVEPNTAVNEKIQRIMFTASVFDSLLHTFNTFIYDIDTTDEEKNNYEVKICNALIDLWKIPEAIPSFMDIGIKIEEMIASMRALIKYEPKNLHAYLNTISPLFYANALDAPILSCKVLNSIIPSPIRPRKWAICVDELEIAPQWLHEELLTGLRSAEQSFFLKLTWSPILPRAASNPEPSSDFTVIRLWNSHLRDPINFCEDLTSAFLSDRFPSKNISADDFLGDSFFTSEDDQFNNPDFYSIMKNLAEFDDSFRKSLIDRNIDPANPLPDEEQNIRARQMDEFFRKAKPIVLLRHAFLKPDFKLRTRKSVTLYAGKQTVFAVSEGNPRWLLGLLNDLCDAVDYSNIQSTEHSIVPFNRQATIINATSRRFIELIKATPMNYTDTYGNESATLFGLIEKLAQLFRSYLYSDSFQLDPVGSIRVGSKVSVYNQNIIRRAVEIGALVHVGKSPEDVPSQIINERFRLSFMICPSFKLPLRNYKEISIDRTGLVRKKHFNRKQTQNEVEQLGLGLEK